MTKVRSDFRVRARGSNSKIRVRGVARLRGVMLVKPLVLTLKSDLIFDIGPGLILGDDCWNKSFSDCKSI